MLPLLSSTSFNVSLDVLHDTISQYKQLLTFHSIWKLYKDGNATGKVTDDCAFQLDTAVRLMGKEIWPIQMVDAWGKFPEGLLSGHIGMMGDFEECMSIKGKIQSVTNSNTSENFIGRYCPMHLIVKSSVTGLNANIEKTLEGREQPLYTIGEEVNLLMTQPTLAACLPSGCTRDDFNTLFSSLSSMTSGHVTPITSYCRTEEKPQLDFAVYGMIALLTILLLMTVVATTVDFLKVRKSTQEESTWFKILIAFSFLRNFQKLMSTDSSDLACLHGLRFGSICWVILCHTWSILSYSSIWNSFSIRSFHSPWTILTIANGTFCVDTFLTLAGFLVSFQLLRGLDKSGKFAPLSLYLHRYLRITPTYAVLLGLIATLQPYVSNGPMWSIIDMNAQYCRKNWWENLLYVNNILEHNSNLDPFDIPCFGEAWYLGCDMQFFWISIWLIFVLWKYDRLGKIVLGGVTVASVVIPAWIIGSKNLMPTSIPMRPLTGKETGDYNLDVYVKPWTRYGPYVAGIWTGYAYHLVHKGSLRVPSRQFVGFGWFCCTATALAILYGPVNLFDIVKPLIWIESVLYGGLARLAWGGIICWIIFASLTGNGGSINRFLSLKLFVPLGRISFCMFLVSYELQQIFHARYPHSISYDVYFLIYLFLGHLMLSIMMGFILTLLIESPLINLLKLVLLK